MRSKNSKSMSEDNCEFCTKGIETMFSNFANMNVTNDQGYHH